MGMYVQNTLKCLRHGDDPGTGFWSPAASLNNSLMVS